MTATPAARGSTALSTGLVRAEAVGKQIDPSSLQYPSLGRLSVGRGPWPRGTARKPSLLGCCSGPTASRTAISNGRGKLWGTPRVIWAKMLNRKGRSVAACALGALIVAWQAQAATSATTTGSQAGGAEGGSPVQGRLPATGLAPLHVEVFPANPVTGDEVRFLVLDAPATAADYRWDLRGRGMHVLESGSSPRISERFAISGSYRVTVRAGEGVASGEGTVFVNVRPRPQWPHTGRAGLPSASGAREREVSTGRRRSDAFANPTLFLRAHRPRVVNPTLPRASRLSTGGDAEQRPTPSRPHTAHAASDPGVTIADFQFTPGSSTVHVGDTVTWTNNGLSSHTATARDGSFDTGVLKTGASASHTFTQPGTFAFYCKIHPFMHGTIVVLAAATSSTSSPSPQTTSTNPTTPSPTATTSPPKPSPPATPAQTPAATTDQTLPTTGLNVATGLCCGLLFLGLGLTLRRVRGV